MIVREDHARTQVEGAASVAFGQQGVNGKIFDVFDG